MGLEDRLEKNKMVFGLGKKKGISQIKEHYEEIDKIDKDKRKTLGLLGGLGLMAMTPKIAKANRYSPKQFQDVELPPGIANCRDSAISDSYYLLHSIRDINPNISNKDMAYGNLFNIRFADRYRESETPFKEPAFYYMGEDLSSESSLSHYIEIIKKKNPPLYYFSVGIDNFFFRWLDRDRISGYSMPWIKEECEEGFLKAIYTAAGVNEEYVKLNKPIEEQKEIFEDLFQKLKKRTFDEQLVAAWASTWLVNHYMYDPDATEDKVLIPNKYLEIPLRKIDKRLKIRGPPWFYDGENKI